MYNRENYAVGRGLGAPGPRTFALRARLAWQSLSIALAVMLAPVGAHAQWGPPQLSLPSQDFLSAWLAMASATQAAQPHWMTPLVTVTPRLEQEFRLDGYVQSQGDGRTIDNYGGGKGLEIIPSYDTEVIFGIPPYEDIFIPPAGKKAGSELMGFGDWPVFLAKYRFVAGNEENGNYIVTGFFQMADPTGNTGISSNVWVAQPTLAFGKGWGDFDIQATISEQYPFAARGTISAGKYIAPGTVQKNFGDPVLVNTAFQYHFWQYFWPELEVNYQYWPNGTHAGLSQVMLTPGLILGRFRIEGRRQLIIGAGYQVAVTPNPVTANNVVVTARLTF